MAATTPIYAIPYPQAADPPAGHTQMQALAERIEDILDPPVTRVYTASATWNKPTNPGFQGVWVEVQGPGGGSGGCAATTATESSGAGGGEGGAYAKFWVPAASLAATVAVAVGTGGAGGAAGANAGGIGPSSSFGAHGVAIGGVGGAGGGAAAVSGAPTTQSGGSSAQTFSGSASNVLFVPGSDGGQGVRIASGATASLPGYGGGSRLGAQTKMGGISGGAIAAVVGTVYGGGGAAPANMGAILAAQAGAAGAPGIVMVVEQFA